MNDPLWTYDKTWEDWDTHYARCCFHVDNARCLLSLGHKGNCVTLLTALGGHT